MKRFSKIFCVALVAIVFFSIGFSAKAEVCTTATPVVFIEAQLIPEEEVTCTVKSCARYCYTAEFIKQIFKDLDTNSTLTNYARKLNNSKSPNWSLDNYKSQVQGACKKDQNTPTDTTDYNNCVAAWDYLTDYWSSFLSTPLPQSKDFYKTDQYKNLKTYVETEIVEPGYTGLTPTNPINTDNRPTAAATTQNSADCANDTPGGFLDCVKDIPLCFFKYINLGIIHSTAFVIKMGVNTMSWLMQPNNLWAPGISNNPAVIQAFGASVSVVNIVFSVVLVMMAIGTILNLKSYKINDLITKFIIVALLINFTLVIAGSILDLANYISLYFYNATLKSIQDGTLTDKWTEILTNNVCLSGWAASIGRMFVSIFINLLVLIAIGAAMLSVCGSLLKRGIMLMFLLIISPFAVICYLLPAKGMGQWWEKWKTSFLQQTFYGVYVSVGFYLGTIMLSALSIPNQSNDIELSFASGLIKPVLAAGYLVFIVLLADEVAGGSAKASITGATKLALGVAGGAALTGATGIVNKIGTSKQVSELATNLSKKGGLSAALGTRLSSFSQSSKNREQENRKAVETQLATMNPDAYKDKVGNLLEKVGRHERLSTNDQIYLAAGLNALPDSKKKKLSPVAQSAISRFTDDAFKAGILTKPEQKNINGTVPVQAAVFKSDTDYKKAVKALETEKDPKKREQLEKDKQAAIADNVGDIVNTIKRYNASDTNRTDDFTQSIADVNKCMTNNTEGFGSDLRTAVYNGLITNNSADGLCRMLDEITRSSEFVTDDDQEQKRIFIDNITQRLEYDYNYGGEAKKIFVRAVMKRMEIGKAPGVYAKLLEDKLTIEDPQPNQKQKKKKPYKNNNEDDEIFE
jgi:hypothetical protein